MRRLVVGALGVVALGCGGVLAFGATRPAAHTASARRTVPAPPAAVWARITDFDRQEAWRTGVADVRRVGDRIEEVDGWGDVLAFRIVEETPERRLVTEIVDQTAFGGTWTVTLVPDADGTRVEVVERGEIHSVVARGFAAVWMDPEATATTWLDDLERSFALGG